VEDEGCAVRKASPHHPPLNNILLQEPLRFSQPKSLAAKQGRYDSDVTQVRVCILRTVNIAYLNIM
jgi:hypothetical protein